MIRTLAVQGYRSLRDVVIGLGTLTVITGANGSGKSNLYRAIRLLADAGQGQLVGSLARSGGLDSVRWAGPETITKAMRSGEVPVQGTRRTGPVRLRLGVSGDGFGYAVDLGLPTPAEAGRFPFDPRIKAEAIWSGPLLRPATTLIDRSGPLARTRQGRSWEELTSSLGGSDSILTELAGSLPEIGALRERLHGWRCYDQLRTDPDAPARASQLPTRTPILAHDGADLAAALATIEEIGDARLLAATIAEAFDGSQLEFGASGSGMTLMLHQPGMLRPLSAAELSDGTLRYLLLVAALLSPRAPELLVLNEPESSLHPDLYRSLARLIVAAARSTQVIIVTHASDLVRTLEQAEPDDLVRIELIKDLGETMIKDQGMLERPTWRWPDR